MRFHIRKRRQTPAVIIVALIDILIVLLIFLMVTSTFKQQPAVKIALPESSHARKEGATENPPFIVSVDTEGNLRVGPEGKPMTTDRLTAELQEQVAKNPALKVAISADKRAPFGQIVKVMDSVKDANIKSVDANIQEAPKR